MYGGLLFVPVSANDLWWCYVWDIKLRTVSIIDPSTVIVDETQLIANHFGTIKLIQESLEATVRFLFSGWEIDLSGFKVSVVKSSLQNCKYCDSGIYTLYCIKNFDGDKMRNEITEVKLQEFKEYMLYELFSLRQNRVKKPASYVESIDED